MFFYSGAVKTSSFFVDFFFARRQRKAAPLFLTWPSLSLTSAIYSLTALKILTQKILRRKCLPSKAFLFRSTADFKKTGGSFAFVSWLFHSVSRAVKPSFLNVAEGDHRPRATDASCKRDARRYSDYREAETARRRQCYTAV